MKSPRFVQRPEKARRNPIRFWCRFASAPKLGSECKTALECVALRIMGVPKAALSRQSSIAEGASPKCRRVTRPSQQRQQQYSPLTPTKHGESPLILLPSELVTKVIDALPLEHTPAPMAACTLLHSRIVDSRQSGSHSVGFLAKKELCTACGDCGSWHLRSRLKQCDGYAGACGNFVCPGDELKHCGTRCVGGCKRHFCEECFSDMHVDHEDRLGRSAEVVRAEDGDVAAEEWWRRTNAYFREETPLYVEGCGWVCIDCATAAMDLGYHQMCCA